MFQVSPITPFITFLLNDFSLKAPRQETPTSSPAHLHTNRSNYSLKIISWKSHAGYTKKLLEWKEAWNFSKPMFLCMWRRFGIKRWKLWIDRMFLLWSISIWLVLQDLLRPVLMGGSFFWKKVVSYVINKVTGSSKNLFQIFVYLFIFEALSHVAEAGLKHSK